MTTGFVATALSVLNESTGYDCKELNKGEVMKTTTMCILSGFFGAMFAVACGVVDGVGDKEANADVLSLRIKSVEFDCPYQDNSDWQDFETRAMNGEIIVSADAVRLANVFSCDGGYSKVFYYIE